MDEVKLGETIYLHFITSDPSDGSVSDADALPDVSVFEDDTDAAIITPAPVKSDTGDYRVAIVCTVGNGFGVGKSYNVVAFATVGGVDGKGVIATFFIRANEIDDIGSDVADVETKVDTAITDIGTVDGKVDTAITDIGTVDGKVDTSITDIGVVNGKSDDILEDTGTTLPNEHMAIQNDLDNPAQYKADVSSLALEANVEGHVTSALNSYDPPTRAQATSDKDEIIVQVNANETKIDAQTVLILRALGLMQENQAIDNTTYDANDNMLTGRLRTYTDGVSVGTDNNVQDTYNITATYTSNKLTTYQVVKE